jgi:hypothetical protein
VTNGAMTLSPAFTKCAARQEGARLEIAQTKPERSISPLRMHRAWLHKVAADIGNDDEELHEFLLGRCAARIVVTIKRPARRKMYSPAEMKTAGP